MKLQEDKSLADLDALAVHQELALSRRELAQHRMREQSEMSVSMEGKAVCCQIYWEVFQKESSEIESPFIRNNSIMAIAIHDSLCAAVHTHNLASRSQNEASWALAMTNRPSPAATLLQQLSASHGSATSTSAATATIS